MLRRICYVVVGVASLAYGIGILLYVPTVPDLGLHSAFGTIIKGSHPRVVALGVEEVTPKAGDAVVEIGDVPIHNWRDLMQAPFVLRQRTGDLRDDPRSTSWMKWEQDDPYPLVRVVFGRVADAGHETFSAWFRLGKLPLENRIPAILWFFLKGLLFLIGALVFWKRPTDDAAAQFYLLCVVTLAAYMGGYHWSQIATEPIFVLVFMVCAVLLPAVSLHFYLIFPRRKAWFDRHPGPTLLAIYSLPGIALLALVSVYCYVKWAPVAEADIPWWLERLRDIIYLDFGISFAWYLGCTAALLHSFWTSATLTERNQVKCILGGVCVAMLPLGYSLYLVLAEPDSFADGEATWPMFFASACITIAFAVSISRYRLMEVDKIISSSMAYFLISCLAGLTYYSVLFVGTLISSQIASPNVSAALTASTTALLLLVALDLARSRFKKALDRRFSRNKSQLDRTLQQMSQAVAQLVDPPVLAQKLLQATTELLGVRSGAMYLRQGEPPVFRLSASIGMPPGLDELTAAFAPLIEAVQTGVALLPPERSGLQPPSMAQRQLQFLGGEIAQPLAHDGRLLAILILGPKDTPYRADDCHLLASFAQITVLALESAAGHRTIDQLNRDLQAKVDKIAEQQRRILALQTQLHRQNLPDSAAAPELPGESRDNGGPVALPGGIVGSSPVVRYLHNQVRKVAATDAVVLIRGESGTGKELLARAVHETSPRAGKPYVKIHCAALTPSLLESELFGHVKGAYTGAHRDKIGRFELANGGTLFLDEIGDVSLDVQIKLLRVLQEKTFERVGSSDPVQVDVRIIAATHQDLEGLIRQGKFREDLYYRLNVFKMLVPPLRARVEDIPELVLHFIRQSAQRCRKDVQAIDDEALAALKGYSWPGNIRELENAIERAVVIAERPVLTLQELADEILEPEPSAAARITPSPFEVIVPSGAVLNGSNLKTERERFERDQLVRAMTAASGNKSEAARALGIARSTLVSRLKKLGLS